MKWSGKWDTNFGSLRIIQHKQFVFGIYSNKGILEGEIIEGKLVGVFSNLGKKGRIEFTLNGDKFEGDWAFGKAMFTKENKWTGSKKDTNISLNHDPENVITGEWDTTFGKLRLIKNKAHVFGLYRDLGTIVGKVDGANLFTGVFTNLGKSGKMKFQFNLELGTFEGFWGWTKIDDKTNSKWTGKKLNHIPSTSLKPGFNTDLSGDTLVAKVNPSLTTNFIDFFEPNKAITYDPGIWKSNKNIELGITLQGGGLKGAFGVGTLHYLTTAKIISPHRKLRIASASTGSLTGSVLAENDGLNTTKKCIAQYLDLVHHEDMFVMRNTVSQELDKIPHLKKEIINILKSGNFDDIDYGGLFEALPKDILHSAKNAHNEGVKKANESGGVPGYAQIVGYLSGFKSGMSSTINAPSKLLNTELSLAQLEPVRKKLEKSINDRLIEQRQTELYMAVIDYNTGALCYITEDMKLLHPKESKVHAFNYNYDDYVRCEIRSINRRPITQSGQIGNGVGEKSALAASALASGAFPVFFEPVRIKYVLNGEEKEHYFFDGGIKENLPIKVLMDETNVKHIISIYCSPINKIPKNTDAKRKPKIMEVMGRATAYQGEEFERNDAANGNSINIPGSGSANKSAHVVHIAPTVGTLSLTEVHPYNIQATIWYGFLRGYDEMYIAQFREKITKNDITEIRTNSEDIYMYFKLLFLKSSAIVRNSVYRSKKGDEVKNKLWIRSIHEVKARKKGEGYLENSDSIKFLFLHEDTIVSYLQVKIDLLRTLINRSKLFMANDPKAATDAFMRGELGFMKIAFFMDWFGVYECLDHTRIASNKRSRLKQTFFKHHIMQGSNPLVIKTGQVTTSQTKNADKNHKQRLKKRPKVVEKMEELKTLLNANSSLFEGSLNDRLIGDFFPVLRSLKGVSGDNRYDAKDDTYIAKG